MTARGSDSDRDATPQAARSPSIGSRSAGSRAAGSRSEARPLASVPPSDNLGSFNEFAVAPPSLRTAAEFYFGDRMDLAERYASLLTSDGVLRGVIGPREAGRIWERHLLNCAAIAPALPHEAYVIDVGSGAGLPGIVLALVRPDIHVVLVEPLLRRTAFLADILDHLGIGSRIDVVRGRAEEIAARPTMFHVKPADVVAVRAVAALDRLAAWCLPLLAVGGRLVAMKGTSASDEVAAHGEAVALAGGGTPTIHRYGDGTLPEPTVTIEVIRERRVARTAPDGRRAERRGRRGR